jgi:hypothetical protein
MNDEQSPPTAESLSNEVAEEEKIYAPQNKLPFPETVDLNQVFPEEENDLNDLFPDEETKVLLKKIQRNKKDLHTMTDRFNEETWSGADNNIDDAEQPSKEEEEPSSEGSNEEPSGDAPAAN